jgi:hypothetical protein
MQSRALALAALILALGPTGAPAQDPPPSDTEEGMALVERGLRSILDGFLTEMKPALDDMGRALTEMRPVAEDLLKLIDDIGNYEAPVVLENGDILIRRKPEPPAPLKEGEVEL